MNLFLREKKRIIFLLFVLTLILLMMVGCSKGGGHNNKINKKAVLNIIVTLAGGFDDEINKIEVILIASNNNKKYTDQKSVSSENSSIAFKFDGLQNGVNYAISAKAVDSSGSYIYQGSGHGIPTTNGNTVTIILLGDLPEIPEDEINNTIYQAFYWYCDDGLWNRLAIQIPEFAEIGITSMWLPPANKAMNGTNDVGYGQYDLWDLGEFDQKGTVETRWGAKAELGSLIMTMHCYGISAYYDAVLNHKLGADGQETFNGRTAWTQYNGIGRHYYYSKADDWNWNYDCFDGDDDGIFPGKSWDDTYDVDCIMGENIDYDNDNVIDEMEEWGRWIVNDIDFDGFRLDAVKHIDNGFIKNWVNYVCSTANKDLFIVGEAWISDEDELKSYLNSVENCIKVFDFPLRNDFVKLSNGGKNLSLWGGLVNTDYRGQAVTFIDNHDTCRDGNPYGQEQVTNYKNQAYCYILLREDGIPCVYAKDYEDYGMASELDTIIKARRYFAYGDGYECENNDHDVYSYVREGLSEVKGDGLVFMISDGTSGQIVSKNINSRQANTTFYDLTGHVSDIVTTNASGYGDFKVMQNEAKGWSIWVPQG